MLDSQMGQEEMEQVRKETDQAVRLCKGCKISGFFSEMKQH